MYDSLSDFLRSFSVSYPLPWAFLVMATVACASLGLYLFWEVLFRLISLGTGQNSPGRKRKG